MLEIHFLIMTCQDLTRGLIYAEEDGMLGIDPLGAPPLPPLPPIAELSEF